MMTPEERENYTRFGSPLGWADSHRRQHTLDEFRLQMASVERLYGERLRDEANCLRERFEREIENAEHRFEDERRGLIG